MNENENKLPHEYEEVEIDNFDGQKQIIFVCVDCGADGEDKETIKHYDGCTPGESKKWEEFYNQPDEPPF